MVLFVGPQGAIISFDHQLFLRAEQLECWKGVQSWRTFDVGLDLCSFPSVTGQAVCTCYESSRADEKATQ